MFTKVSRFVPALVLAAVLAAPAAASVPPPTVTQVKSIITILPPIYHPGGYWLTGNVTTTKEPGGSKGRYVALFYKSDNLGIDYTGTTRGHSAGYWQVRVPNLVRFPFDAYVMDRFNSQLALDELPAATPGVRSVAQDKSTITILPPKATSSGFWFTGKVTTGAEGAAQAGREVLLLGRYHFGANTTGSTRGHSAGYWQVKVTGWAGISLSYFNAYAVDRFWPALRIDSLPAQSAVIPFR
ncbi:MAG TPA: hypothetical protein VMU39_19345 [Solirubrobacteraceae bacterium]|nr:hypothetical protein [Solirubrobacteraceae bacterium]